MKKSFVYLFWIILVSCNEQLGPGYSFDLFDKSQNKYLAKAVESEDINEIESILKKGEVNINLQEPTFGRTILLLAVGNGKLKATKILLEAGASVTIRDNSNNAPINEASKLVLHDKNACKILELLIKYKADVNSVARGKGGDSIHSSVPLSGVVGNFKCAKLLLDNGADPNFKNNNSYPVWINLLTNFEKDNIFVAKYIIIEKKIPVPSIILHGPNGKQLNIYDFLNGDDIPNDREKQKARQDILNYLRKIRFKQHE